LLLIVPAGFIRSVELDAVVRALAPRLIGYALARTGCLGTAEDVAQDALTALVRRWRQAGPPESPDAFAFAIAKRRAGRVIARRALMAPLDVIRSVAGHEPSVADAYEHRAELAIVRSALRSLSRSDREALLLRSAGELSFEDIAAVVGVSTAAVKMRISRARRRLAALVQEHSDGRRKQTA
jgi:RNA polymerase sigma factor (sigma-70 family)